MIKVLGLSLTLYKKIIFAKKFQRGIWPPLALARSVTDLGHVIFGNGVAADPSKIQAMVDWPTPTNIHELQGFWGLTNYYRKFVAGYAHIASPLIVQLRKDQFVWSLEATHSKLSNMP